MNCSTLPDPFTFITKQCLCFTGMGRFARLAKSVTTATRAAASVRRVGVVETPVKTAKGFSFNEGGDTVGAENAEGGNDKDLPKYMREAPRVSLVIPLSSIDDPGFPHHIDHALIIYATIQIIQFVSMILLFPLSLPVR